MPKILVQSSSYHSILSFSTSRLKRPLGFKISWLRPEMRSFRFCAYLIGWLIPKMTSLTKIRCLIGRQFYRREENRGGSFSRYGIFKNLELKKKGLHYDENVSYPLIKYKIFWNVSYPLFSKVSWNVSYPLNWCTEMFHTPFREPGKCFIPRSKTLRPGMQVKKWTTPYETFPLIKMYKQQVPLLEASAKTIFWQWN